MSFKFATFTMHDGKTLIKINPLRVNYLTSQETEFTKIHFGLDQTVNVIGDLQSVEDCITATAAIH